MEPKAQSGEDAAFKPMTEIFKNIVAAVISNSDLKLTADDCSLELEQNPSMAPTSADRYNATRPDGYLVVKDRLDVNGNIPSWADIDLSCECKQKDGSDELDDASILRELWDAMGYLRFPLGRAEVSMKYATCNERRSVPQ
jgi:hypothetical protein